MSGNVKKKLYRKSIKRMRHPTSNSFWVVPIVFRRQNLSHTLLLNPSSERKIIYQTWDKLDLLTWEQKYYYRNRTELGQCFCQMLSLAHFCGATYLLVLYEVETISFAISGPLIYRSLRMHVHSFYNEIYVRYLFWIKID